MAQLAHDWSDHEIATLRQGAADGHPARYVAEMLGLTRNSVLGKAARLGVRFSAIAAKQAARPHIYPTKRKPKEVTFITRLPSKSKKKKADPLPNFIARQRANEVNSLKRKLPAYMRDKARQKHFGMIARGKREEIRANDDVADGGPTLWELGPGGCKWPGGRNDMGIRAFCGLPRAPLRPYCAAHYEQSVERQRVCAGA